MRFFVRMDNVTDRMLSVVNSSMSEKERQDALNREMEKIQKLGYRLRRGCPVKSP